jgi:Ca-activated chloride channel family protein
MIEFLRPWVFLLLPLPVLAWYLLPALPARATLPVPATVHALLLALSHAQQSRFSGLPVGTWLRLTGWIALIIALAGPQTPAGSLLKPSGRDMIIALDLSSSMGEEDMQQAGNSVSRLSIVHDLLSNFISSRSGDRTGLIAFAQEAFLIAPLTFDTHAVAGFLDQLAIGLPGHRTDLGGVIGLAIQTFRTQPPATRILILLSDGEDNAGDLSIDDAARLAGQYDIRIHTIGFSAEIKQDGAAVLRRIAQDTGGEYFAAQSAQALAAITGALDRLEPIARDSDQERLMRDWSWLAILSALAALAGLGWQEIRQA